MSGECLSPHWTRTQGFRPTSSILRACVIASASTCMRDFLTCEERWQPYPGNSQPRSGRALCELYQIGKIHEITAQSPTVIVVKSDFENESHLRDIHPRICELLLQLLRTIIFLIEILLSMQRSSLLEGINYQDLTQGSMTYYACNHRINGVKQDR